jgi:hypothetical protein
MGNGVFLGIALTIAFVFAVAMAYDAGVDACLQGHDWRCVGKVQQSEAPDGR